MRVFVYEFITAAARWCIPAPVPNSLLAEGNAMLAAVVADFCAIEKIEVIILRDASLPRLDVATCCVEQVHDGAQEPSQFRRLAASADATFLIAPETGGELLRRVTLVEACGGRLLSPPARCVALAANKQATADHLAMHQIRVPTGCVRRANETHDNLHFPLIAKPLDGCGSQDIRFIPTAAALAAVPTDGSFRLEPFIPGTPASVAILCGPTGNYALPTCEQQLSTDGYFTYLGGRLPLANDLSDRAQRLALAAVATLPAPHGYLGVDLILGAADDGSEDFIIEINPRLTTSYVGLRVASHTNLAAAMLDVCNGHRPNLCFAPTPVKFTAAGLVVSVPRPNSSAPKLSCP